MKYDLFSQLILDNEDWLMERILSYAKDRDYTMYTSTLKEAWRLSIVGLSTSFVSALKKHGGIPELAPTEDYRIDEMTIFGSQEARQHRSRGIDPGMFIGLFKYYKQTYRDLTESSDLEIDYMKECLNCVERFFDRVEIAFLQEWVVLKKDGTVQELQEKNRQLTNDKNKYLTIFESMADPVILLDSDGYIDNINVAAASLLNIPAAPGRMYYGDTLTPDSNNHKAESRGNMIRGNHVREYFPLIDDEISKMEPGQKQECTFKLTIDSMDDEINYEVHLSKMLDVSYKFTGTVVTFIDITYHNRIEEMLKSSQKELEKRVKQRTNELILTNKELEEEVRERKVAEDALRIVVEGTSFAVGDDFFHNLVRNIANVFNVPIVLVAELIDTDKMRCKTLSIWNNDGYEDNVEFDINNMPCKQVYQTKDLTHYSETVKEIFPQYGFMEQIDVKGYLSYPLLNLEGEVIGHLGLMDSKPINRGKHFISLLKILSIRSGTELERKKVENERENLRTRLSHAEKLSFIGTFISSIAHELNNPLSIIFGFSQRLLKSSIPANSLELDLKIISEESKRAAEIVKNLLEISRKQKPSKTPLQVNDVVKKAVTMQSYQAGYNDVLTILDLSGDLPKVVGNANQLQQVFANVFINAYQAMQMVNHSKGKLLCSTEAKDGFVIVTIYNDGQPIPGEIIDKVFDPFFSSKESGEGMGLGLFVSHGIVEDHGGKMWIENVRSSGVKLTITLPIDNKTSKIDQNQSVESADMQGARVLFIDDEINLLDWVNRTLTDVHMSVDTAINGVDAIDLVNEKDFDIIISDIRMPKMDGLQFANWLKRYKPHYLKKLIITTGVIDDVIRDYCNANDCEFLVKPFVEEKILEIINKVSKKNQVAVSAGSHTPDTHQ